MTPTTRQGTTSRAAFCGLMITVALVASAFALLLAGCPDKKPKYPICGSDKECQAGEHCVNKKCLECGDSSHCPAGEKCVDGACKAQKNECASSDDCGDGKVCEDGACVACTSNDACGPGGKCTAGACERPTKCSTDEDCADDEDCIDGLCQRPWSAGGDDPSCQLGVVYFDYDRAAVEESARETLTDSAECMKANARREVDITGHSDESGTEEYNIALSERRARAVADYLARLGIDPARFFIVPKGEADLSGQSDAQDRRVELGWR